MATTNESPSCRKPFANLRLDDEDDDEDAGGAMPSHLTKVAGKKKKACQRRRRRSSARFLKLSQPSDYADEDDEDEEEEAAPESEQLGELYKRAIRMNAENRINAGNSWNLKLIENMDKLTSNENGETVNFTKASCTLDASVKIYSYRVDDVHLTSYKVLANLNRNDAIEKKTNNDKIPASNSSNLLNAGHDHDGNDEENDHDTERTSVRKTADTLETNLGTIHQSRVKRHTFRKPINLTLVPLFSSPYLEQQTLISVTSTRHMTSIRSFTKCQKRSTKEAPKVCFSLT